MTDPTAAATLSGNPRRGTLVLPAPRPTYEIEATRTATGAELTLRCGDRSTRVVMTLLEPGLDPTTMEPVAGLHHTIAPIDGYLWQIQADPEFRTLRVYDQTQPYRGPWARVDDRGRVVE